MDWLDSCGRFERPNGGVLVCVGLFDYFMLADRKFRLFCRVCLFVVVVVLPGLRNKKGFHSLPGVFASASGADVPVAGPLVDGGAVFLRRGRDYSAHVRCVAAGEDSGGLRSRSWNGEKHVMI